MRIAKGMAARVNRVAHRFGVEVRRFVPPADQDFDNWMYYSKLLQAACTRHFAGSSGNLDRGFVRYCMANFRRSKSQIFQDLLVLFLLRERRGGFFVEFGATDGVSLSNSFLLERDYGWQGIVAEPARIWHRALRQNRTCAVDTRCVWSKSSRTLLFNEAYSSELSTVDEYTLRDHHAGNRAGTRYGVKTVSLNDLLNEHRAPRAIDYLSIDTEGSEYAILKNFDFSSFEVGIITVEHNFAAPGRENIAALLRGKGFSRVLQEYSLFDDWYVQERVLATARDQPT